MTGDKSRLLRVGDIFTHVKSKKDYRITDFGILKKSCCADTSVVIYVSTDAETEKYVRTIEEFSDTDRFIDSFTHSVKGFFGEYRWLSNFWLATVDFEGLQYPSTEAAYQSAKTLDLSLRKKFANLGSDDSENTTYMKIGRAAKRLGKQIQIRPDWEDVKKSVMLSVIREKFKHPELSALLLSTGNAYLEETNSWNDIYWGVCNGIGENNLGKILMQVRDEIRLKEAQEYSCNSMYHFVS